jgi:hypothetical protein
MSKLRALREKIESLTISMQTFCMNPSLKLFKDICACESVKRAADDNFPIWEAACLFKYGHDWGIDDMDFIAQEEQLCARALENPSMSAVYKIFKLHINTARHLNQIYKNMKDLYQKRYVEFTTSDPRHFIKLNLDPSVMNFTYFDNARERAIKEKELHEEQNKIISSMQ